MERHHVEGGSTEGGPSIADGSDEGIEDLRRAPGMGVRHGIGQEDDLDVGSLAHSAGDRLSRVRGVEDTIEVSQDGAHDTTLLATLAGEGAQVQGLHDLDEPSIVDRTHDVFLGDRGVRRGRVARRLRGIGQRRDRAPNCEGRQVGALGRGESLRGACHRRPRSPAAGFGVAIARRSPRMDELPAPVRAAWPELDGARVAPLGRGLVNDTFEVAGPRGHYVVQRLHRVFSPRINENVEAVALHLYAKGLITPRLVRTRSGDAFVLDEESRAWRMITWVDGVAHDVVISPAQARAAGRFVGRWHAALEDLDHEFVAMRVGVHDTQAHVARLRTAVATSSAHRLYGDVARLHEAIEATFSTLSPIETLTLVGHGDLKINNLLFEDGDPTSPVALVDLDTVGPQSLAFELGDAMRSWCNPAGEVETGITFDLAVHDALVAGWVEGRGRSPSAAERAALASGVEWITLELAARFLVDALEEKYFGWDASRFPTRGAHNLARGRGQWRLHTLAVEARDARLRTLDTIL